MNTQQRKKKDTDIPTRIIGTFTDELEKVSDSVTQQFVGGGDEEDRESPIVEAMRETLRDSDDKNLKDKNTSVLKRKFIRSKEELEDDLKRIQKENREKLNTWREQVDRQMKIVEPGEDLHDKNTIVLTSKPKRGMMPGMPGTAKSGTGMEVVKSKQ